MNIEKLLAGLAEQPLIPSRAEAPKDGTKLGDVSDELQRLWSLRTVKVRELDRLKLDFDHCDNEEDRKVIAAVHAKVRAEASILNDLFWFEVRSSLKIEGEADISLTKDWEIWSKPQCDCPSCKLAQLLEGVISIHDPEKVEEPEPATAP